MPRLILLISLLVLLIGSGAIVAQPKASLQDSSISITGTVQSQGKPISEALITLWEGPFGDPSERSTVATARTDIAGNYELKNVRTGNYLIGVSASGFVTGKENDLLARHRHVTVAGGKPLNPFDFELVREGVISGIVIDAAGKPIPNIPITLIAEAVPDGAGPPKYAEKILTDDQGRYRVAGMPAGKYRIAAGDWPLLYGTSRGRLGYRRVFYPNADDQARARVFDISAGTEATDINFNLGEPTKTFTVRGMIIDERTGKPVEGLNYRLLAYLNGKQIGGHGSDNYRSNDRGEIVLPHLPPGEYSISVSGSNGLFRRDEPQTPNYSGESQHFEVVDKDVSQVEVRVTKAASVAGVVVVDGPAGADVLRRVSEMILIGWVETNPITPTPLVHAMIRPDGSFLVTGLRTGKLKLNVAPPPVGKPLPLNLVRTELDGVKVDGLEVRLGEELKGVRLVMSYANSSVHGFVKLDDGSIPQGLIGLASVEGNVMGNRSVVNQNGEFILQNLMAGEYELHVAAHDAMGRPWQVKQKIRIEDDSITEAKIVLDSRVKPNPAATSSSYLQP